MEVEQRLSLILKGTGATDPVEIEGRAADPDRRRIGDDVFDHGWGEGGSGI